MNLLCWAATFGTDPMLDGPLAETRAAADAAVAGSWVPHDRAALGVLFYRGMERMRAAGGEDGRTDSSLRPRGPGVPCNEDARRSSTSPAACGRRPSGAAVTPSARDPLASEAAALLDEGSPSLLNEAPVFLALHDACVDLGRLEEGAAERLRGVSRGS